MTVVFENHRFISIGEANLQSFLARFSEWSVELGQTWAWKALLGMVPKSLIAPIGKSDNYQITAFQDNLSI